MHVFKGWIAAMLCGAATSAAAGRGVAVTEFLVDPDGTDAGREWIELFNDGPHPVDLAGWVLSDEGSDTVPLPPLLLAPGGYAVLVSGGIGGNEALAKSIFEAEWLGGAADSRVVGIAGMALANGTDEIVLRDGLGVPVWSLAYANDDEPARATFFTETWDFTVTVYGSAAAPGVVRNGDDNGVPGFLGYQQNDFTADALAAASDISQLALLFGEDYANVAEPSVGSPLLGAYVAVTGDLNGDGRVGIGDLLLLLAAWGPCPAAECSPACPADLDRDCAVGIGDLLILLGTWGT